MYLDGGFTAAGTVRLAGADITGEVGCRGAQLTAHDSGGNALVGGGMKVSDTVWLDGGSRPPELSRSTPLAWAGQ